MGFFKFIFILPFYFAQAAHESFDWGNQGEAQNNLESARVIQTLKEEKDCDSNPSTSSLIAIHDTLEKVQENSKEQFICEVGGNIKSFNAEVDEEQAFMLNYIQVKKHNPDKLKYKDHLRMTELMIKYRLLRKDSMKEYFLPATRYDYPSEVLKKLRNN